MRNELIGWNTWDPAGVNRFIQPELDLELIVATLDVDAGVLLDEYSFHVFDERKRLLEDDIKLPEESLGTKEEGEAHRKQATSGIPDTPMGWIQHAGARTLGLSHGHIDLSHYKNDGCWAMDIAANQKSLAVRISVPENRDNLRFVLIARAPWGHQIKHEYDYTNNLITAYPKNTEKPYSFKWTGNTLSIAGADSHKELLEKLNKSEGTENKTDFAIAAILEFNDFEILVTPKGASKGIISVPNKSKLETIEEKSELLEAESAVESIIGWNLCWDALYNKITLPQNKEWVRAGFKGMALHDLNYSDEMLEYVIGPWCFAWDAGFCAIMAAHFDIEYGKEIAKSAILDCRKPDGGFATCRMGPYQMTEATNPPILIWACFEIFEKSHDLEFLRDVYADLKNAYIWMKKERDRNNDGLYEWGCNPDSPSFFPANTMGRLESGLDNTPMYYDVPYSEEYGTFAMNCVDLSAFQAMSAEWLLKLSKALKYDKDIEFFSNEHAELKKLINNKLWDSERGVYVNRLWSGEFGKVVTPTSFYPMLAGIPDQAQAGRMINEWLLNPEHFGTEHVIPSVDAAHESYLPDGNYWRGRIWGPMNYIVYHAVKRYDAKAAAIIAKKSLNTFLAEWRRDGHIHENYSALTGFGEGTVEKAVCSTPYFVWGGLMALMALEEE